MSILEAASEIARNQEIDHKSRAFAETFEYNRTVQSQDKTTPKVWQAQASMLEQLAGFTITAKVLRELKVALMDREVAHSQRLAEHSDQEPVNHRIPIYPTSAEGLVGDPKTGISPTYRWLLLWEPDYKTGTNGSDNFIAAELNVRGEILIQGKIKRGIDRAFSIQDEQLVLAMTYVQPGDSSPARKWLVEGKPASGHEILRYKEQPMALLTHEKFFHRDQPTAK